MDKLVFKDSGKEPSPAMRPPRRGREVTGRGTLKIVACLAPEFLVNSLHPSNPAAVRGPKAKRSYETMKPPGEVKRQFAGFPDCEPLPNGI